MTLQRLLNLAALLLIACAAALTLLACSDKQHRSEPVTGEEEQRVTSPSGRLDAVLLREDGGGAAGGWEWEAYIVPRGNPVLTSMHPIFFAGTLRGEKLTWTQEHLLEIHYDLAHIHEFRNLWGVSEIQNVGSTGQDDYLVEVRLVPSSPGFSLLTAAGSFKPKE